MYADFASFIGIRICVLEALKIIFIARYWFNFDVLLNGFGVLG